MTPARMLKTSAATPIRTHTSIGVADANRDGQDGQGGPCRGCWVWSRLTAAFGYRARADKRCLGGPPWWLERGKFFGRRAALQGEGEAFVVVPGLPAPKGGRGGLEVREALPAPELLLIDSMAPLDFAVLLRPPGSNVVVADAGGLDPQHKGE